MVKIWVQNRCRDHQLRYYRMILLQTFLKRTYEKTKSGYLRNRKLLGRLFNFGFWNRVHWIFRVKLCPILWSNWIRNLSIAHKARIRLICFEIIQNVNKNQSNLFYVKFLEIIIQFIFSKIYLIWLHWLRFSLGGE